MLGGGLGFLDEEGEVVGFDGLPVDVVLGFFSFGGIETVGVFASMIVDGVVEDDGGMLCEKL